MNENKVPCGGFRIGDGLTMEGDTLKSLGGAYVKVKVNINDNDEPTLEFADDSPLKTFEEIMQKMQTSVVTLLVFPLDVFDRVYSYFFNDYSLGGTNSINFCALRVTIDNKLGVEKVSINSDNTITLSTSEYALTPAA